MITRKELFTAYEEYLNDSGCFGAGSAGSYASYVRGAVRQTSADALLDQLCAAYGTPAAITVAESLGSMVADEIDAGGVNVKVTLKTLRNYKSGVAMLIPFLESVLPEVTVDPAKVMGVDHIWYSQGDLKRIFKSRLSTQDRNYADSSYPARLITKINKRRYKLYDRLIDNVKFIYSADGKKTVLLKDITSVIISGGLAYVNVKGDLLPVYTGTYRDGHSCGYRPADVTSISLLSLDHDSPMKTELAEALKLKSALKKLSEDFNRYYKAHAGEGASKIATGFFNNEYDGIRYNESALMNEVKAFVDSLQLTIMHKSDNSSKNSND